MKLSVSLSDDTGAHVRSLGHGRASSYIDRAVRNQMLRDEVAEIAATPRTPEEVAFFEDAAAAAAEMWAAGE
ncbi:MAG: hypothetical protein JWN03_292 [Nocardia sp.]|nr:hypothetical protein [Nocardia sp.]